MTSQIISPKRKAIADSSRTMFGWVAGMSAVVGVCVVVGIFLTQQILFKMEVVGKMTGTLGTLRDNNKVADELTKNVVVLETDAALNSVKANDDEKALQVVLDALPADRNPLALASSLQQRLLLGIDGLTVESLLVDSTRSAAAADSEATIPIQIQVSATNVSAIKDMLVRLENSIRIIDVDNFLLERSDTSYQATISAHAYYNEPKEVKFGETTIMAGGKATGSKKQ